MNAKMKGSLCGIVAAVTYGLNPLGALSLYSDGINVDSVMFYRYGLAMLVLAGIMLVRKESFYICRRKLAVCVFLGMVFGVSSISLFTAFHYMDAGVACTILFVYPVMVAMLMTLVFKEKTSLLTAFAIVMALGGIGLLYKNGDGTALSTFGVVLVMLSALSYAVYIVAVNKSKLELPPVSLTFFVMLFGMLTIVVHSLLRVENHLQLLTTPTQWGWAVMLALVPTVISLIMMVVAVQNIGSTPTAIMGALEPVTAVFIGVAIFNESFTPRIASGIVLILLAVTLIIAEKPLLSKIRRTSLDT